MPSLREICREMEWRAVGSAQDVVRALVDKDYLQKEGRSYRFSEATPLRRIPILGTAPAGPPSEAYEAHEGELALPTEFRGPHFALKIRGDSMTEAGIEDGDFVIVKQKERAQDREIIVGMEWGEVTVKRLIYKRKKIWLKPENPRYSPWEVTDPDFRVLGQVVGLHRYGVGRQTSQTRK